MKYNVTYTPPEGATLRGGELAMPISHKITADSIQDAQAQADYLAERLRRNLKVQGNYIVSIEEVAQ